MRFYRILLNIFSSTSRSLVGLLLGIIATPLILDYLGEERFGAFRVLMDWTSYLGILEMGLFPSLLVVFSKALSHSSNLSVKTVSREAFKKYASVIIYQAAGLCLFYFFVDTLVPVSEEIRQDLHHSLFIIGFSLLFSFAQIYRAYLDSSQRGYVISTVMIIQNISLTCLSLYFAFIGWGIRGQALAFTASIGISSLMFFLRTHKHLQKKQLRSDDEHKVRNALKQQRNPNFIATVCGRASLVSDNLIVAAFLSAKTVTAFYLTQRLIQIAMSQLQQISNATWPAMSEVFHKKQEQDFARKILEVTEFVSFASGALLSVLCFVNPPFVILWTGESTFAGLALSCLTLYNVGLVAIVTFWQWCFTGTGLIQRIIPVLIVQAVVNVGLSLICTKYFGILGPLIGTFVSFQFVTIIWQSFLLHRTFGVPLLALSKSWAYPMAFPVASSIFAVHFFGYFQCENWFELILYTAVIGLSVSITFPFLFMRKNIRQRFIQRMKRVVLTRFR